MMLVGELGAKLSLYGKQQFDSDLASSGKQFLNLGDIGNKVGNGIASTVKFAASATTVLASAAAAVGVGVLKTGLAYNQLQQTSRAALRTLTGGAEQANEQMDKLDAFARTSPFSKSVFLSAQQQLLGFGVEAKKVIPILDSVQNATAAVGGSNADIEGLVSIFAKIQSSAKITAEDLNMFGGRGVDAAGLIGLALGKTGQQIREEITAGTLAADVAIDALTQGMQAKFGGASANVKQTISGTVDRIKAASREIGAAMAEPFVSQQGGGLFVTWGNQVADVLQAVRSKTAPIVQIVTTQLQPAFATVTRTLDSIRVQVKSFNVDRVADGLETVSSYAPAVAGLGAAWATMGLQSVPVLNRLVAGINPVAAALLGVAAASPEVRAAASEVLASLQPLTPVVTDLVATGLNVLNQALPTTATAISTVARAVTPLVGLISEIPTPVLAGVAAFIALNSASSKLSPVMTAVGQAFVNAGQHIAASQAVSLAMGNQVGVLGASMISARAAIGGVGTALKAAFLTNPAGIAVSVLAAAVGGLSMAFASAAEDAAQQKERVASLRETLVATTGAYTDLTRAAVRKNLEDKGAIDAARTLGVSVETLTDAILGNADAQAIVNAATSEYSEKTGAKYKLQIDQIGAARLLEEVLGSETAALVEAAEAQRLDTEEKRAALAAMTDLERSNYRLNEAIAIASDASKDATTRLNALKIALDELKGGAISAEEAQKRLSETNLSLAEGLAQANDAGTSLWASTLDGAGKIDIASRSGLSFADSMGRSRDAMLLATQAAYDQIAATGDIPAATAAAQSAGEAYIETLRQTMQQAGLTDEQINGLIGSYLDVPAIVATFVTDNTSISEVDRKLLDLAARIEATPDKTVTITEPLSPEVIRGLEALNYTIENLQDGEVKVTATGTDNVENAVNYVARTRTSFIDLVYRNTAPPGIARPNANGGHYSYAAYANGGTISHAVSRPIREFRNGGMQSGMFRGGTPIYKFAEEGVPWETFLSGKPSAKTRNQQLTLDTARRLDMSMDDFASLGAKAYANGGNEAYRQQAATRTTNPASPIVAGPTYRQGDVVASFALATQPGRSLADQAFEAVQRLKIRRKR